VASINLTKYKQIQHLLEDAEERADLAENSLAKFRAKSRSSVNVHGLLGLGHHLRPSASSAAVLHHSVIFKNSLFYINEFWDKSFSPF
jgi:hypothetical protein